MLEATDSGPTAPCVVYRSSAGARREPEHAFDLATQAISQPTKHRGRRRRSPFAWSGISTITPSSASLGAVSRRALPVPGVPSDRERDSKQHFCTSPAALCCFEAPAYLPRCLACSQRRPGPRHAVHPLVMFTCRMTDQPVKATALIFTNPCGSLPCLSNYRCANRC